MYFIAWGLFEMGVLPWKEDIAVSGCAETPSCDNLGPPITWPSAFAAKLSIV